MESDFRIGTGVCKMCGKVLIDRRYYSNNGNAMTNFVICDECK